MSDSVFPGALDDFTNPAATDKTNGAVGGADVVHSLQHGQSNDAIEAIETKLGVDGSTDPSSIDYRVSTLETTLSDETADRTSADSALTAALADKADLVAGKVPSAQLPSYVDDVLEYANLAAFPGTGETGKIYVALDTSLLYRWTGSVYFALPSSPGTTDDVVEGSGNLYFTAARVLAVVLTGLSTATNAVITAGDSILAALGKLQAQINAKLTANAAITAATKTKITYDANGLVTGGTDATTADIADSTNKRYVSDAQLAVLGNTSGTNTGDQTNITGNAATATKLQTARSINGVSFDGSADITIAAGGGGGGSIAVFTV